MKRRLRPAHLSPDEWRRISLVAAGSVATAGWEGILTAEGVPTGDGRFFSIDAISWAELPVPLRHTLADVGGHDGAVVVGLIDGIERLTLAETNKRLAAAGRAPLELDTDDARIVWGAGVFDLGSDEGREAHRQVRDGFAKGVSVDLDSVDLQIEVSEEMLAEMDVPVDGEEMPEPEPGETDDRVVVGEFSHDEVMMVVTAGRIRATTLVATPAFAEAQIWLTEAPSVAAPEPVAASGAVLSGPDAPWSLTASARVPDFPPRAWFADPKLPAASALTILDDGRIFGHAAAWSSCHIGFADECVPPPHSATGYAYFHLGAVRCDDGTDVAAGHITLGTGHAGNRLSAAATIEHYDNTGTVVADVCAGEDAHGIWVAGALRPECTTRQLRQLRSAPLSGDWRGVAGNLELVAALAVNVPGFGIPRAEASLAASVAGAAPKMLSLVAAGMVHDCDDQRSPSGLSADDTALLRALADGERRRRRELVASAAPGIRAEAARLLAARVGI